MRAERDVRIRNGMMAVPGVLRGHSTKTASDFAGVDRRTAHLWAARFNEDGLRYAPGWDKVPVTDNASRYRHGEVKKCLKEHDGMENPYLPTAAPKLSAVESVWKDAKYRLVTSERCETPEDPAHAVSEHFGTCTIRLDIYRFPCRCVWGEIFNGRHSGTRRTNWQT